jgi:pimeloyl-ACP methyl ester carboxylesterase
MREEQVLVQSGVVQLAGTLYLPDSARRCPVLIVLHAASGGERGFFAYRHLVETLPAQGIGVLLYDRRGSGASSGDWATTSFADQAADCLAAIELLSQRDDVLPDRFALWGISEGGWIAPIVAAQSRAVAAMAIISGAGVTPAEQMDYAAAYTLREAGFGDAAVAEALALRERVNAYYRGESGYAEVAAALHAAESAPWFAYSYIGPASELPADVTTDKWFYEFAYDALAIYPRVQTPALFVWGAQDRWVPAAESMRRFCAATAHLPDRMFAQLPGADHLMMAIASAHEDMRGAYSGTPEIDPAYMRLLIAWLREHLL